MDKLIAGLIGVAVAVAIAFWNQVLDWATESLFPWFEKFMPQLEGVVREAFRWFDTNVAVPVRHLIKQSWQKIRQYLLKEVINFERNYGVGNWTRILKSFLVDPSTEQITKTTVTEKVDWEELPDDVRAEFLRNNKLKEVNIKETRDKQIETIQY